MLSSASYALCFPFTVGKEKKNIYCVLSSLNVCRHFVSLSIYMLNSVDNDGKQSVECFLYTEIYMVRGLKLL